MAAKAEDLPLRWGAKVSKPEKSSFAPS